MIYLIIFSILLTAALIRAEIKVYKLNKEVKFHKKTKANQATTILELSNNKHEEFEILQGTDYKPPEEHRATIQAKPVINLS